MNAAKKIIKYYKDQNKDQKFKAIIIFGERGYGMSMYCTRLISEVYSNI